MLIVQNVSKRFGEYQALNGVSMEIRQGETFALLGPNGAGKTTLIKILATLISKDSGQVEIVGCDLDRDPETIRHRIGYVGQDTERSAYARLTVMENLEFFGALRGMNKRAVRARVDELAGVFDFGGQLRKQFVTLSGGQKQTVVILRALLHDPPLIYLDEPTKGLDPIIARRIRAFLKDYVHERGKSLLLTSHILSEVEEMADRVALIRRGQIHVTGAPRELKETLGAMEFIELEKRLLPEGVLDQIRELPDVRCLLEREHGWVSFGVDDLMSGAEAIIRVLRAEGVQTSFRHHSASLEDAFLQQIGQLDERFEA